MKILEIITLNCVENINKNNLCLEKNLLKNEK